MSKILTSFYIFALLSSFMLFSRSVYAEEAGPVLTGKVNATVTRNTELPFNAIIDEVLVNPGDQVAAGTPLMTYHLPESNRRILKQELTIGANTESQRTEILNLRKELSDINTERNKTRQLVNNGLASKQALARLDGLATNINERINLIEEVIKKNESNFNDRLKELSDYFGQNINAEEDLPEKLILKSPISGYVLAASQSVNPDQLLSAGFSPFQIGQIDPVIVRVPVYETELKDLKIGDTAQIEIPSLGDKRFEGIVTEIDWTSSDMNVGNPSYYTVEITVPNNSFLMKPGFKAIARF